MESKSMKKLKYIILLILFVAIFQACTPIPATAITDANQNPISIPQGTTYRSSEPILGQEPLTISSFSVYSISVSFGNGTSPAAILSNYGGQNGTYLYRNGTMNATVSLSGADAITVTISSLNNDIQFELNNVVCNP